MTRALPPNLKSLTADLRDLNEHLDGPGNVALSYHDPDGCGERWQIVMVEISGRWDTRYGNESLPGDGQPFDAVAAARRLLAAVRDGSGNDHSEGI